MDAPRLSQGQAQHAELDYKYHQSDVDYPQSKMMEQMVSRNDEEDGHDCDMGEAPLPVFRAARLPTMSMQVPSGSTSASSLPSRPHPSGPLRPEHHSMPADVVRVAPIEARVAGLEQLVHMGFTEMRGMLGAVSAVLPPPVASAPPLVASQVSTLAMVTPVARAAQRTPPPRVDPVTPSSATQLALGSVVGATPTTSQLGLQLALMTATGVVLRLRADKSARAAEQGDSTCIWDLRDLVGGLVTTQEGMVVAWAAVFDKEFGNHCVHLPHEQLEDHCVSLLAATTLQQLYSHPLQQCTACYRGRVAWRSCACAGTHQARQGHGQRRHFS